MSEATYTSIMDHFSASDFSMLSQGPAADLNLDSLSEADKILFTKLMVRYCLGGPIGAGKTVKLGPVETSIKSIFNKAVSKESIAAAAEVVKNILADPKYDSLVSGSLMWQVKGDLWPNGYVAGESKTWATAGAVKHAPRVTTAIATPAVATSRP